MSLSNLNVGYQSKNCTVLCGFAKCKTCVIVESQRTEEKAMEKKSSGQTKKWERLASVRDVLADPRTKRAITTIASIATLIATLFRQFCK